MRNNILILAATTALIGLASPTHASEPTVTHERGIVIECSGTFKNRAVYASVYENEPNGNVLQILVGDDESQVGGGRETTRDFLDGKRIRATMKVDGTRATIEGTAERYGKKIPVHEEHDDAGQHIVVDGTHRKLDTDLTLTWRNRTVPLDCDTAFAYDLRVSKESTVED